MTLKPPAILGSQNNETVAMLVFQTNPVGFKLFSHVNTTCFVLINLHMAVGYVCENAL